jgi:hypothetical protein
MPSSYLSAMHLRVFLRLPTAPVTLLRWRANYYAPPRSQDGRYNVAAFCGCTAVWAMAVVAARINDGWH